MGFIQSCIPILTRYRSWDIQGKVLIPIQNLSVMQVTGNTRVESPINTIFADYYLDKLDSQP